MSKTLRLQLNGEARLLGSFPPSTAPEILERAANTLVGHRDGEDETAGPSSKADGGSACIPHLCACRAGILFSLQTMEDVDRLWNGELLHIFQHQSSYFTLPVLSAIPSDLKVTAMPSSTLELPLSKAPLLQSVEDLTCPTKREDIMRAIQEHGHFFISLDEERYQRIVKGRQLMKDLFEDSVAAKRSVEMEGRLRIWGWKRVDHKRKECFKMRYCQDMEDQWPSSFPPRAEMLDVFDALYDVGRSCAKELLMHGGLSSADEIEHVLTHRKLTSDPTKELAASFFEVFRYEPHCSTTMKPTTTELHRDLVPPAAVSRAPVAGGDDAPTAELEGLNLDVELKGEGHDGRQKRNRSPPNSLATNDHQGKSTSCAGAAETTSSTVAKKGVVSPCEDHYDVGLVTVSIRSTASEGGLQIHDWKDGWVQCEPRMPEGRPVAVVLLGEHLEAMTGGVFSATPHRVVVATQQEQDGDAVPNKGNTKDHGGALLETRFSMIAEVLPFPEANVVVKLPSQNDGKEFSTPSWNVFKINSLGVSSVNFE